MKQDKDLLNLSVVTPIYNEEESLEELYSRLSSTIQGITKDFEIIFIDDGSTDKSLQKIIDFATHDQRIKYISFTRNFGHQNAVMAGLNESQGKAVVIIDGDLQDPPELITELFEKYQEGYDVVFAQRQSRKGESLFKKVTAKVFYRLLKKLTSIEIPIDTGDFRIIDRKVILNLKKMPEKNKFLRGQIAWMGYKSSHVLFNREERKHGKSGYSFYKMLKFALDGITGFSNAPLQLVTQLGFLISISTFFIILYALISHFVLHRTITGWTSLIISFSFIGGVQLLSIGIIGEYIGRINSNVIQRPDYIVDRTNITSSAED